MYVLISETQKSIALYGKRGFAHTIKSRILRWEGYLGLSRWAQCFLKDAPKREAGVLESEEKPRQKQRSECYRQPLEARKAIDDSPQEPAEGIQACQHIPDFWSPGLLYNKFVVNFVTTAIRN